jgi:hypothetical protein
MASGIAPTNKPQLNGALIRALTLETLERPLPESWEEQRGHLGW